MSDLSHRFNWHEEPENSFLKWMLVHFGSTASDWAPEGVYEKLSAATDKFSDVELRIVVSGVEVDAHRFIGRLDEALEHSVERGVARKIAEDMPRLHDFYELLTDFEREMRARIVKYATEHGVEFREDDWR